ncbi:MAG: efflux RND transporter permease subunit [Candidatus Eisenbacteria bacterium]|uniref:Efflux RND transporter permease subunit n=1 Tax=Eiseniibacteriota bacterium TaxID=2212470 RepID=A0A538U4W6_UNCEI|nr:MAG: efflux RND transporter permease subunit [Candidatus Eisenbacteria bacterium]
MIRASNEFVTPEEIGNVILVVRQPGAAGGGGGTPDAAAASAGGVIRVSDVARVGRGIKDRDVIARLAADEAVEISVYKEGDANTVAVARAVKRRVQRLQLPPEMKLATVADQSRFIEDAIADVTSAGWLGALLAVVVLFAFLRQLGTTLIVALTIPVSVFATFVIMYRFGLSFNLMSLGGLALAIGHLLDCSIVVLESIFRKREEGLDAKAAAAEGASTVAMAVTASTLTTVAVFFPLVFVEGLAGQLFRDQALTISVSQIASLAVALTLVPTLAALGARFGVPRLERPAGVVGRGGRVLRWMVFAALLVPRLVVQGVLWIGRRLGPVVNRALRPFDAGYAWLERVYPIVLGRALRHRAWVLGVGGASLAVALAIGALLPQNLFPPLSQGEFCAVWPRG